MSQNEKVPEIDTPDVEVPTPASDTTANQEQEQISNTNANAQEAASDPSSTTFLTGRRLWFVYASVLLTVLLVALDESIVSTALPRLSSEFQALDQLTWVVSAFILAQAGLLLFFGQVLTIVSSKSMFLFCIIFFETGSLLCALSPNINVLIFSRSIQGVGGSGLFISILTIISQIARLEIRPVLIGSFGGVFGVAAIFGPLLGGVFTDRLTWRWCFYINLPFGAISLISVIFLLPWYPAPAPVSAASATSSSSGSEGQTLLQKWISLDWIGAFLSIAMTTCLLIPLQAGGVTKEWNDPFVIALLTTAGILFILLILWEWRMGDRAMMPLSILLRRTQLSAGAASFTVMIGNVIFTYWLPFAYQAKGATAQQSGINIIPFMMALVSGSGIGGWLNSFTGQYTPFLVLGSAMCAVAGGLFFATDENTSTAKLVGYQILLGFGQGMAINQPLVAVQAEYADTPHLIPQASSQQTYLWLLGALCGISMAGAVFGNQLSKNLAGYSDTIPPQVVKDVKQSVAAIFSLPPAQQAVVVQAYIRAVDYVYLITVPASIVAILAALLIKNRSLKKKAPTPVESAP